MTGGRDAEYTEYVAARLSSLRRLAAVLCDDWQRADDLVQAALAKLYLHWGRVRAASHADAYARAVLVHEFIHERRSLWVKRVILSGRPPDTPAAAVNITRRLTCGRRSRRFLRGSTCTPHDPATHNTQEIINGYRVVLKRYSVGGVPLQELCGAHADGLWFDIQVFGAHPSIDVASLFRDHMRLLGANPANWTKNPIG